MVGYVLPFSINPEIVDPGLARIEKMFNDWGWIPVIGTLPGMLRQFLGLVELITAVALVIFNIIRGFFIEQPEAKMELFKESAFLLYNYARHGIGNIIRGQVESIPVVNLILYLYNRTPDMRMKYLCEDPPPEGFQPPLLQVRPAPSPNRPPQRSRSTSFLELPKRNQRIFFA